MRGTHVLILGAALAWGSAGALRGDVFELKDGGAVAGALVKRLDGGDYLIGTADGAQLTLTKNQVQRVVPQSEAFEEHTRRSRTSPDTVESHRRLAAWCAEHGLTDEAAEHLARVAELDPNDEAARRSLGFQLVNGQWLTRDQIMHARGMQMYEGKYRTPQDIAIRQRNKQQNSVEIDWYSKIRLWRGWLNDRRPERVEEAQRQLATVDDPRATPALVKLLADEDDEWAFDLLLAAVGRMRDPLAVQTLVAYSLHDDDLETRERCLDYLMNSDRPASILPYVQALKDKDNLVVNRAGTALGKIGDQAAISPLIDALVTRHKYQLQAAPPGQINAGFNPNGGSGGLQMGGNGPQIIERDRQNQQVLRALEKLSGAHEFDYDEQAWRRWYVDRQMREHINSRRDE